MGRNKAIPCNSTRKIFVMNLKEKTTCINIRVIQKILSEECIRPLCHPTIYIQCSIQSYCLMIILFFICSKLYLHFTSHYYDDDSKETFIL